MKKFNFLFSTLLLACLALSFIAPNNLDKKTSVVATNSANVAQNSALPQKLFADTISKEELQKFVHEALVQPIMNCMEKKEPELFMTKCYTRLEFDLNRKEETRTLYAASIITGTLIFINCSEEIRMADITVKYQTKEIFVKESIKTPKQDLKSYLSDICKYINKNGIPTDK